tara:strand:- start:31553 stop:31825 length:273 start_codon:yes stop_codon:yes gene_type:complete
MGSQALTLKCRKCQRGMWGKRRIIECVRKTSTPPKMTRQANTPRWKHEVRCHDCGHVFWTTHASVTDNYRAIDNCTTGAAINPILLRKRK